MMNPRDYLFTVPAAPTPPEWCSDCALEWREGWRAGWEAGTGKPARDLHAVKRYSPQSGRRKSAYHVARKQAREALRQRIAELWPVAQREGRRIEVDRSGYPLRGVLYGGVLFYPFGNMKLPAVARAEEMGAV